MKKFFLFFLLVFVFLISAAPASAQVGGACAHQCGLSGGTIGAWGYASASAAGWCNAPACIPEEYSITTVAVTAVGCGTDLYVEASEDYDSNGYQYVSIRVSPAGYPGYVLAVGNLVKTYTGYVVSSGSSVHTSWQGCLFIDLN